MLSEENKKNLDSFKTAMRQEVRNAGYFLEDIPDMIQEKKLERAYEKELAAKDELEKLKREEVIYRLRLRDCGYADIEEAYGQAKAKRELTQEAYSSLFEQYAATISQLGDYKKKGQRMNRLVAVSLSCIGLAWFFSFVPLFFIGIVVFVVALIVSRSTTRAKKLAQEQMPPDLLAAQERKLQAEEAYEQIFKLYEAKKQYEEILEKIRDLEKQPKGMD